MNRLVLSLICSGCLSTNSFAQSPCGSSSGGSISQGSYVNERIGLSYHIPSWLSPADPKSYPRDPKGRPTAILLALWKTPHDVEKPSLIIMTDDPFQYRDPSALAYVRRIANTAAQNSKVAKQAQEYKISGITFYRVDYEFIDMSPKILNVALTGRVGKCELSFQLNATKQDDIDKLFQSIIETTSIKPTTR